MNILVTALLTTIAIGNIAVIFIIAWALRKMKDGNSRIGCIVILSCLISDLLAIGGGVLVW